MPAAVAAFRPLLLTGCRLSEIKTLRRDYVKDDCIELRDAKTGGRTVPLGPKARAVLAKLPRIEGNPWVIPGRRPGTYFTDLQRPWQGIRERTGLEDVRIHYLRHWFASQAAMQGIPLPVVARLLGHAQVQMTLRYAHVSDRDVEAAAERIGGVMAGIMNRSPAQPEPAP